MMRIGKSLVFWRVLGLFILAIGTFLVFTGTHYILFPDGRYFVSTDTSQIMTGIVSFLAGLYMVNSGRNKPGSLGETVPF
jgi:small neutral amino acid transporter SnatA (MarC family)